MPSIEEKITSSRAHQVCALISEEVRKKFGDEIQNAADIDCSRAGYTVRFTHDGGEVDERMRRRADVVDFIKRLRRM